MVHIEDSHPEQGFGSFRTLVKDNGQPLLGYEYWTDEGELRTIWIQAHTLEKGEDAPEEYAEVSASVKTRGRGASLSGGASSLPQMS